MLAQILFFTKAERLGRTSFRREYMSNRVIFALIATIIVIFASTAARAETFYAYLNGAQEVPVTNSTATGYARIFVNESTVSLTFTIVFNGLSSNQTASHIHAPAAI